MSAGMPKPTLPPNTIQEMSQVQNSRHERYGPTGWSSSWAIVAAQPKFPIGQILKELLAQYRSAFALTKDTCDFSSAPCPSDESAKKSCADVALKFEADSGSGHAPERSFAAIKHWRYRL